MKTEDAVTIIPIGKRTVKYQLTEWNTGSALVAIDDDETRPVKKAIVGYDAQGRIIRKEQRRVDRLTA